MLCLAAAVPGLRLPKPGSRDQGGEMDIIERHFAAEYAHDVPATLSTYTDDVITGPRWQSGMSVQGKAAISACEGIMAAVLDLHIESVLRFGDAEHVVDEAIASGHLEGSFLGVVGGGVPVSFRLLHAFDLRDGLIAREQTWFDTAGVLRQMEAHRGASTDPRAKDKLSKRTRRTGSGRSRSSSPYGSQPAAFASHQQHSSDSSRELTTQPLPNSSSHPTTSSGRGCADALLRAARGGRLPTSDRSGALRRRTLLRTGRASFPASGSSKPWWLAGVAGEVDEMGCSGVRGGCVPDDVDRLASGGQPLPAGQEQDDARQGGDRPSSTDLEPPAQLTSVDLQSSSSLVMCDLASHVANHSLGQWRLCDRSPVEGVAAARARPR
jgi:uncharacterized protein